ncbi:MAG: hypothetical protein BWY57_02630 [Betaproteobacteria bacterium ADurb.Bin341]|nr:MAG: hypothetical protein BWY57_02630 [Betaproteobacteria bacterium ADurb.Bin341]
MVSRDDQIGDAAAQQFAMQRHKIQRGVAICAVFHQVTKNEGCVRRDPHVAKAQEDFF